MTPDSGTLAGFASVVAAFGSAMLLFRIQREDQMRREGERVWLPVADWLLVLATWACLLLVIVPISANLKSRIPPAASAASAVLVAGYIPSILAHYRIIFGARRSGPRDNPEPMERFFVICTLAAAAGVGLWAAYRATI